MRDTTIRYCPNADCAAHEHVIYTQGTRCQLCRWDLKRERPRSEAVVEAKPAAFRRAVSPLPVSS